ncbi:Phosphatidylethanolamine-binding protein PEBP [Penicillium malachiteum]|nr:Phosphatidylethanolamine-binding protein PEBP [Penicillium malachiteum]
MSVVLHYMVWCLGRLFYPIRGHDSRQFIYCPAFKDIPKPNMTLECEECGPSGSKLLLHHTSLAEDGIGSIPDLKWTPPQATEPVKEYVLICEDIDLPIPFLVIHHGLFWGIDATKYNHVTSMQTSVPENSPRWKTTSSWNYVPNLRGAAYIGASPVLGHGTHRYVFTIVALKDALQFDNPEKVTKSDIKKAIAGKVVGWGQWTGEFEKPWPQ